MNAFYQHHKDNILFNYHCFDRILLNGVIQPFQQPERVVGFFSACRNIYPVSRDVLRDIANQYHNWVTNRSLHWEVPILEAPKGRRDEFMDPYFKRTQPDKIVAIIKAREPARILVSIGKKEKNRYHLDYKYRWVNQYNFYLNDSEWGRMFVRVCPYFPFPARVCLNQHHWLANRMQEEDIRFKKCANGFIRCSDPQALQKLADSLTVRDLKACGHKWLTFFTPFFTDQEKKRSCQHRLFFSQVEYCDNLVFRRRAAVDQLNERLLDANRTIGQPDKITTIFGRHITKKHSGKLKTTIHDMHLGNPVIRSHYKNSIIKQYLRDERNLRTEAATNDVRDYRVGKAVKNLPELRNKLQSTTRNYLDIQQDILETFVDRGQLHQLSQPTIYPNGKRIPGLKLDHPRQLALMQSLLRFSHIAGGGTFTTAELHPHSAKALGFSTEQYPLSSLRYDLSKLRAKGLVEKIPCTRRYRLLQNGYRICLVYLKIFEKIYAPLTASILRPFSHDAKIPSESTTRLDGLYRAVTTALDQLVDAVGLKAA